MVCGLVGGEEETGTSTSNPAAALTLARGDPAGSQQLEEDSPEVTKGHKDVWHDRAVMQLLQHGGIPEGADVARVRKRAEDYEWREGKLFRYAGGGYKEVPPPSDRLALTKRMHAQAGHWGAKRTTALLATAYWWSGMGAIDRKSVV